jgi:hypothetical protein
VGGIMLCLFLLKPFDEKIVFVFFGIWWEIDNQIENILV